MVVVEMCGWDEMSGLSMVLLVVVEVCCGRIQVGFSVMVLLLCI